MSVDQLDRDTMVTIDATAAQTLERARSAQALWSRCAVTERLRVIRRFRESLPGQWRKLADTITLPSRAGSHETLAAEIVPLADACRYLERIAELTLRPRRERSSHRPWWCIGQSVTVLRQPHGTVLVIAPWNYPLLLAGVQAIQALVAGNAVIVKPGREGIAAAELLGRMLRQAGLDEALYQVTDESPQTARRLIAGGVDKIVLTGSAETGRAVLRQASDTLTPTTMELSGSDAVFVLPGADPNRVAGCLAFGLRFNGSATCIAPRRVFIPRTLREPIQLRLIELVRHAKPVHVEEATGNMVRELISDALDRGGELIFPGDHGNCVVGGEVRPTIVAVQDLESRLMKADVFAPIMSLIEVESNEQALRINRDCAYALGASVFGPATAAAEFANSVWAGCVTVNDLIVPTGDPRVPFGGWGRSGFGMTRGREGLLEMTRVQAMVVQRRSRLPHLGDLGESQGDLLAAYLQATHGSSWQIRFVGWWKTIRTALRLSYESSNVVDRTQNGHSRDVATQCRPEESVRAE